MRLTGRTGTKVGYSDPEAFAWKSLRLTDQRYARDNRLMVPKSSYRRDRLAPRCRLIASWRWRSFQWFGCSPIKAIREMGLERRETVRFLSSVGVKNWESRLLVREDRSLSTYGRPVVVPTAQLDSYVELENYWKHLSRKLFLKQVFHELVEDDYVDRQNVKPG